MFCNHCGKQIDVVSSPEAASATTYDPSKPIYTVETFHKRFSIAWREFVTQPFALILLCWYFVSTVLNIIQINTLLADAEGLIANVLPDFASIGIVASVLIQLLLCAPSVLTIIGMWLIYEDARDHSDRPLSSKGPTLIYVTTFVNVILSGIGYVVSFFAFIASTKYLSTSIEMATILTWIFFGMILGSIPAFFLLKMYVQLTAGIRNNVKNGTFATTCVKVAAILEFVFGGLGVVALFASKITLGTLLAATLPFLIGTMLLKYKRFIDTLHWEYQVVESGN